MNLNFNELKEFLYNIRNSNLFDNPKDLYKAINLISEKKKN